MDPNCSIKSDRKSPVIHSEPAIVPTTLCVFSIHGNADMCNASGD